jgi:hypothetical protein
LDQVYEQIKNYQMQGYSAETQDKMQHNAELFHNRARVDESFQQRIVEPLMEFING